MKYCCKYCGQEFEKSTQLGSHVIRCEKNPKYSKIQETIKEKTIAAIKEKHPKLEFKLICPICGKEYSVYITQHKYDKGDYCHTCSVECSHKLSAKNSNLEEKNKKIGQKLKNNWDNSYKLFKETNNTDIKIKINKCCICGKSYVMKDYRSYKYCSKECSDKGKHNLLSAAAIRNKVGGLKPEITHTFYKRGYYNGIWCDSSWELAYLIYCLDHNIPIKRNKDYFNYTFDNNVYKFYPDFIVDGVLVEIKGFYTPKNKAKKEQYPNIEFIDREKIKPYLKYVIEKYGKDFIDLYDN